MPKGAYVLMSGLDIERVTLTAGGVGASYSTNGRYLTHDLRTDGGHIGRYSKLRLPAQTVRAVHRRLSADAG